MNKAIICDVDGTVALMHGNRGPFDWDKVSTDRPNNWVIDIVHAINKIYEYQIIFLSGRSEECYNDTIIWLNRYMDITSPIILHMRPVDQLYEKDAKVKHEMYLKYVKPFYDVQFVIDDRKQVVDMWRNVAGLPVMQVAEGNF